jgi:GNAT superfamily N-acetyltransferase
MGMVPLCDEAIDRVLARDDEQGHRSVSLRHALIHRSPGLWGDHPRRPRSVVLVREDDGPEGRHAFGLGEAEPAVGWLSRLGRRVSLLAPTAWEGAIRRRGSAVLRGIVETWVRSPGDETPTDVDPPIARRLGPFDEQAFLVAAPSWALQGWGSFAGLIREGAAFGVPDRDGRLLALAWTFEADDVRDALAVATVPRYRRLGLGRAAGSALVAHVEAVRGKEPIWTVACENLASKALARSLGFSARAREVVLRWGP